MVSSLSVGRLGRLIGARILSTAGMLCVSGALLGLSFLGAGASYAEIVLPLVILGMGGGLFLPPNNSAALNNVPPERLSVANGFMSTARTFGQAIGAALAATFLVEALGRAGSGAVLASPAGAPLAGHQVESFLAAQQFALRLAATLGLLGAVISLLRGPEGPVTPPATRPIRG